MHLQPAGIAKKKTPNNYLYSIPNSKYTKHSLTSVSQLIAFYLAQLEQSKE